jgi:hypothetical protein
VGSPEGKAQGTARVMNRLLKAMAMAAKYSISDGRKVKVIGRLLLRRKW